MHPLFGQENGTEPYVAAQAMNEDDIRDVVEQFALAAKNAIRAGFDGVETHGLFFLVLLCISVALELNMFPNA